MKESLNKGNNKMTLNEYKRFQKKTYSFDKVLKKLIDKELGYSWGSNYNPQTEDGENFSILIKYPSQGEVQRVYNSIAPKLKEIGAKKFTHKGSKYTSTGEITFFIPKSAQEKMLGELNSKEDEKEAAYKASIESADISKYKPSDKVLNKLRDYRDRGSRINVNAIKDVDKVLTYLWGAILLDMNCVRDLTIKAEEMGVDKSVINAIHEFTDKEESDTRSNIEKKLGLPKSDLFTFDEQKSCWLPKQFFKVLIDNNIPVHFLKRKPGGMYDNNGLQWTETERLILFPDTDKEFEFDVNVHTLESGGRTTYSSGGTGLRVGINEVIDDLKDKLEKKGLLKESLRNKGRLKEEHIADKIKAGQDKKEMTRRAIKTLRSLGGESKDLEKEFKDKYGHSVDESLEDSQFPERIYWKERRYKFQYVDVEGNAEYTQIDGKEWDWLFSILIVTPDGEVNFLSNGYKRHLGYLKGNEVLKESLKEDFYWDEEDSFFTRDDLNDFQAELEDVFESVGKDVDITGTYMEPVNNLEVDWEYEGYGDTVKVRIDMRRIRAPRDLIRAYLPIVVGEIRKECEKIDRELNESYLKEDWDSLRDLAEEMINYLNDNDVSWVDIYRINDDGPLSSITLEIDGDWKHDHLRANYLLNMKYGDRIKSIQDYSLEDTGSDWGKEAHVIRLK